MSEPWRHSIPAADQTIAGTVFLVASIEGLTGTPAERRGLGRLVCRG